MWATFVTIWNAHIIHSHALQLVNGSVAIMEVEAEETNSAEHRA